MFRQITLSLLLVLLPFTSYAQPVSKDFQLTLGSYTADLLFLKKNAKVPYDGILFETGKMASLKTHFDFLEKDCELQKKLIIDSCETELEVLKLNALALQDQIEHNLTKYHEDLEIKSKLLASLETQLSLEKKNLFHTKIFLYSLSGVTLVSGVVLTYLVIK